MCVGKLECLVGGGGGRGVWFVVNSNSENEWCE